MKVHRIAQRSDEWRAVRLGKLTGSRAADALATLKKGSGEAAGRRNLRVQLVLERLTGQPHERTFSSWAMTQGAEAEADARRAYEAETGTLLTESGFVEHDDLQAGASVDGHTPDWSGIIEIKAPYSATHLDYLRTGKVPHDYLLQITHGLWITGAAWCDFMSFDPSFPEGLRTKRIRVRRTDLDLAAYEKQVRAFLAEVDAEEQAVRTMADLRGQLQKAGAA